MSIVEKINQDIEKKIRTWNERSCFTLKGVKNLSKSDLDMILLYAQQTDGYGNFPGFMPPRGGVKDVLTAYGLMS